MGRMAKAIARKKRQTAFTAFKAVYMVNQAGLMDHRDFTIDMPGATIIRSHYNAICLSVQSALD